MNQPEIIEGEIVGQSTSLAVASSNSAAVWTPTFAVAVDEMVGRVAAKHDFFKRVMRAGDHYGVIPGTGTKPTLLKPGAELLLASMGLNAEFHDEQPPVLDVTGAEHGGEPFISYRRECRIYRQLGPTEAERMLVARASGECNSWEKKYRYRNAQTACPVCGKTTIFKSKNAGEGWYCWRKKDGCGATFKPNEITPSQDKVPNPEIFDQVNTLLKMADKRALVAATLIATGCSDIFTQDVEDLLGDPAGDPPAPSDPPDPKPQATRPANAPPEAQKIDISKRSKFNRFISEKGIPPETVSALVKEVQEHYGNEPTGYVADLYEGDEALEAERRLKRKAKELAA